MLKSVRCGGLPALAFNGTGATFSAEFLGHVKPYDTDLLDLGTLSDKWRDIYATNGVIITAVDPASDAAEKGIRPGFVILSVNQQPVRSPNDVAAAVDSARRAGRTTVLLLVKSGNNPEAFVGVDIGR